MDGQSPFISPQEEEKEADGDQYDSLTTYLVQSYGKNLHADDQKRLESIARDKMIEDEFDIIEDTARDQALISYYNDAPSEPEKVTLTDKVKQGITNLGFLFTTNGSKKVVLQEEKGKG